MVRESVDLLELLRKQASGDFYLYVKRHFGYARVRYRGLEKNRQRLALLLGFANLLRAAPHLA